MVIFVLVTVTIPPDERDEGYVGKMLAERPRNVLITRTAVTVSGYETTAVLVTVEAWAETVPALV